MGFDQISAPERVRTGEVLSADNAVPDRFSVVELMRRAGPALGLKAPVLATLEALLSFLPPKRSHHTVFASNASLTHRLNGITERTLRRHVEILLKAGLLDRHDSPNGKRYSRHSRAENRCLRFGFDLSPLFARLRDLAALAVEEETRRDHLAYLRQLIRANAAARLKEAPEDASALAVLKALRRNLSLDQCEALLALQEQRLTEGRSDPEGTPRTEVDTAVPSASNGQNVRHQQKSKKENIDKKGLSLPALLATCTEAASFAPAPIRSEEDVVRHATMLAPMIGIDKPALMAAERHLGSLGAAVTVWVLLQMQDRISKMGAYFRAVTSGPRKDSFDPYALLERMMRAAPA